MAWKQDTTRESGFGAAAGSSDDRAFAPEPDKPDFGECMTQEWKGDDIAT